MNKDITLDKAMAYLKKVPYINSGGCGIAAFFLYNTALKNNLNVSIKYLYTFFDSNEDNLGFINGYSNADACSHIVIHNNETNQIFDCRGIIDNITVDIVFKVDETKTHTVTVNHLINSIWTAEWNPVFQREKMLPIIEKFFGYKLPTLEK